MNNPTDTATNNRSNDLFDRETRAGFDPATIARARIGLIGMGAAGTNIAQTLALLGVGELRGVDFDLVEPSNLTRMPLLSRQVLKSARPRSKAREVAARFVELSYAESPLARVAVTKVQSLGDGAFADLDVLIAAVDSQTVRAYLSDLARRLGLPFIELGFEGSRGQVSVYPNRAPNDPCWRCLHPRVTHGSYSCAVHARAIVASGRMPATQTAAAVFANLAVEAALRLIHGETALDNTIRFLDIRTGMAMRVEASREPVCAGHHEAPASVEHVPFDASTPVRTLLDHMKARGGHPRLRLAAAYIVSVPCASCGAEVRVNEPEWKLERAPTCAECSKIPQIGTSIPEVVSALRAEDPLAQEPLSRFGYGPMARLRVDDERTGAVVWLQLAGSVDQVFETISRRPPNSSRRRPTDEGGDAINTPEKE